MRLSFLGILFSSLLFALDGNAQSAVRPARAEEKQEEQRAVEKAQEKKAKRSSAIEFRGQQAFKDKELRSALKEQISTIDDFGLSAARADDVAFFLEVFYRKHGYYKVSVRYKIESGDRLALEIAEGPLYTLGRILFDGNEHQPAGKLFDYVVGPTRERYSKAQKNLPFVEADIGEGVDLVHRLYTAEGYLDSQVQKPRYTFHEQNAQVDVLIPIREGRQYFFGNVVFRGKTIYDAEELRGQISDLTAKPYTDARVADIPRRLQAYYKTRGYYAIKALVTANPESARAGRVPVEVAISTGPLYHFDNVSVSGLQRLHPSYVEKRFAKLEGKVYSPEVVDEKFRRLMRSGLFNVLQIRPEPIEGDLLHLQITAEEAKSKQLGLSGGYGTFEGFIGGVSFREANLFGTGRSGTFSVEVSQRSYKGEILYEDPYLLDSEYGFKARVGALTFDFDGYNKFEIGGKLELNRQITKRYLVGLVYTLRHVEVTSADIKEQFLGPSSYLVGTLGLSQTFDLRDSPLVNPRGFVADNTIDFATSAFGSEIELFRTTLRLGYYLPFAPKPLTPGVVEDESDSKNKLHRWFQNSGLAFGARLGLVHSLSESGGSEQLPIDERFFMGGATTVRSFEERNLGPHDKRGHPIGGEFYTVFNVEYTFPIYGELQGAMFFDAGNLQRSSEEPSFNDMRFALGLGLRYKLPIGPIRLDYGFNPDPRTNEAGGAFHFSFGFAF